MHILFLIYVPYVNSHCELFIFLIIMQLLRRSGNSVELLDVSNELPELVHRPGLSTWKVLCAHFYIIPYLLITLSFFVCVQFSWYVSWV